MRNCGRFYTVIALRICVRTYSRERITSNNVYACPRSVKTFAKRRSLPSSEENAKRMWVGCWISVVIRAYLWLKRKKQTGQCQAITHHQRGNRHKISDWSRFREFAQQHGDKTQGQMASLWGDNVTQQNISDALGKLGLSRKKRPTATLNGMNSKPSFSRTVKDKICKPACVCWWSRYGESRGLSLWLLRGWATLLCTQIG